MGKQSKTLRQVGKLVSNLSIPGKPSQAIALDSASFLKLVDQIGESTLLYLKYEDKKSEIPVLIDELQYHPLTGSLLHASFRQVDLTEKVEAEVEFEFVGEPEDDRAVLLIVQKSIVIEALPADLPENIEVDLSQLKAVGDTITAADLALDTSKINLVLAEDQEADQTTIALLQEKREEEVEAGDESEETLEPEILTQKDDSSNQSDETPS